MAKGVRPVERPDVYIAARPLSRVEPAVRRSVAERLAGSNALCAFCGVFHVRADGSFEIEMTSSSGRDVLDALCLDAARRWRFEAGTKNGEPIDSYLRLRFEFGD